MTYEIKAECPECGCEVDGASAVGEPADIQPEPGDLAICLYCAAIAIYDLAEGGTLSLRHPTLEERLLLSDNEDIIAVRQRIFDMLGAGSE